MNKTYCPIPIVVAIQKAKEELSEKATNSNKWFQDLIETYVDSSKLSEKEMEHITSNSIQEVNKWIKDRGFDIQLDEDVPPGAVVALVVAAHLNIQTQWQRKPELTEVWSDGVGYKALKFGTVDTIGYKQKLPDGVVFGRTKENHPVARITMKNGDFLWLTMNENKDPTVIPEVLWDNCKEYSSLFVPCVTIDEKPDVSFAVMTQFGCPDVFINQALQQTKFSLSEEGTSVRSVFTARILSGSISITFNEPLIFNKPFQLWITREGINLPILSACVDESHWEKSCVTECAPNSSIYGEHRSSPYPLHSCHTNMSG